MSRFEELRRRTAPQLLAERARREPVGVAYRAKNLGLYEERTWHDYASRVGRLAAGLQRLGLNPGERVAIMGDACEEWLLCDLAVQAAGAISFGVYPTASVSELEYQMRDAGASVFIAEDQEYVDKLLSIVERLPGLKAIVVIDDSAMFAYRHPLLRRFADLLVEGDGVAMLEALAARLDPTSPAFIVYTSGTTGNPKGAVISHGRHLAAAYTVIDHYPTLAENEHRTVVYLPLCHIFGRDLGITVPLLSRLVPHFGEGIEDLPQTLFEVAPTVLFTVPRYLQKFASQVLVALSNTSRAKRVAYDAAMRIGRRCAAARWNGTAGPITAFLQEVAGTLAFQPILNKLGLDRVELLLSGGAPLAPETMALWQIWGVNVVEAYGQTETAGAFISGQRGPFPRPGNVGTVVRGWQVELSTEREIVVTGPDLYEGYWGQPPHEGVLRTGDVGDWRDGCLRIVDRARDFIVTAGGKTLSPTQIENTLRASPYIAEVMVYGDARKYLTALVEIDFDAVADWARSRNIGYTGFTSLAEHADVAKLIGGEIARANRELARVEQVKRFRILPKALDPEEEGEPVTPTRKVKRTQMYQRFAALVESMYDDREEKLVAAEVGETLST
ncbi:MAG: long-chain fatty acid--CoA ligase [Burkholderiales bacterium]